MEDPMYQANARRIQRAIANADGLTTACDVIEQCLVNAGQLF